jgi:hypothetical protein
MAGKQGYAKVEFNGEEKLLRFDFNAMADVEELFDRGIATLMSKERVGFSTIRALYWAGLKWKMQGLTITKTGQMLQEKLEDDNCTFEDLMIPIKKAITVAGWIKTNKGAKKEVAAEETDEKN